LHTYICGFLVLSYAQEYWTRGKKWFLEENRGGNLMMNQKTPEGKVEALLMHYAVIAKMTGVYSNYFQNEASAIVSLQGPEILKNSTGWINQEESEGMVSGN
jgi:hypothetical protein